MAVGGVGGVGDEWFEARSRWSTSGSGVPFLVGLLLIDTAE
jgi:hypothetical protein